MAIDIVNSAEFGMFFTRFTTRGETPTSCTFRGAIAERHRQTVEWHSIYGQVKALECIPVRAQFCILVFCGQISINGFIEVASPVAKEIAETAVTSLDLLSQQFAEQHPTSEFAIMCSQRLDF